MATAESASNPHLISSAARRDTSMSLVMLAPRAMYEAGLARANNLPPSGIVRSAQSSIAAYSETTGREQLEWA